MANPLITVESALWTELATIAHPSGTGYLKSYMEDPRVDADPPLLYFQHVPGTGRSEPYAIGSNKVKYTYRFEIGTWVAPIYKDSAGITHNVFTISTVVYSNKKLVNYILGEVMNHLNLARLTNTTFHEIRIISPDPFPRPYPKLEPGKTPEGNYDYFIEAEVEYVYSPA